MPKLTRPDERVLRAIANLSGNPNFETIKLWLQSCETEELLRGRDIKDEVENRWSEGQARCLAMINEQIVNAKEILEMIAEAEKMPSGII